MFLPSWRLMVLKIISYRRSDSLFLPSFSCCLYHFASLIFNQFPTVSTILEVNGFEDYNIEARILNFFHHSAVVSVTSPSISNSLWLISLMFLFLLYSSNRKFSISTKSMQMLQRKTVDYRRYKYTMNPNQKRYHQNKPAGAFTQDMYTFSIQIAMLQRQLTQFS